MSSMKFFSKMIDTNHVQAFEQYGITKDRFETKAEVEIYKYIKDYIKKNGKTPTVEELSAQFEDFVYTPTRASFDTLVEEINSRYAKAEIVRLIQGKANNNDLHAKKESLEDLLNKKEGHELIDFLVDNLEQLKAKTQSKKSVGRSIKTDWTWFKDEYLERESGKSFKMWQSSFPTINQILGGGYISGNSYTVFARSGRGKSIWLLREAIEFALKGATVIYYSLEMPAFEIYSRAYSMISAALGLETKRIDGIDYAAGFPQKDIAMAKMTDDYKQSFFSFVETLEDILTGNLIFRCVDDSEWYDRSLRQIEADIIQTNADVVVIDPIYLLKMEKNTSRKTGGDMEATSVKLRSLVGRLGVVLLTATQADEGEEREDEEGRRELSVPQRSSLKKSKAIIEDSSMLFGLDTVGNRGLIVARKTRSGGEGTPIEFTYVPNYGIVKELEKGEKAKEYFEDDLTSIF